MSLSCRCVVSFLPRIRTDWADVDGGVQLLLLYLHHLMMPTLCQRRSDLGLMHVPVNICRTCCNWETSSERKMWSSVEQTSDPASLAMSNCLIPRHGCTFYKQFYSNFNKFSSSIKKVDVILMILSRSTWKTVVLITTETTVYIKPYLICFIVCLSSSLWQMLHKYNSHTSWREVSCDLFLCRQVKTAFWKKKTRQQQESK